MQQLLDDLFTHDRLLAATFSQPRKGYTAADKITVQPFDGRDGRLFQFAAYSGKQVFHENLSADSAAEHAVALLTDSFHQALLLTADEELHISCFAKPKIKRTPRATAAPTPTSHDRERQTLLRPGTPVPFLIELGVMSATGQVYKDKMPKLRQINRFLELLRDGLDSLPSNRPARIVDFGCGKSYLTFALHHYLTAVLKREAVIVGLDLKADVIDRCNDIASRLDCQGLSFAQGEIKGWQTGEHVDMVIALHACDTATDDALVQAVSWGCKLIYCVPCCQHEFFKSIDRDDMAFVFKHGLLKERTAALVTDALRAAFLEACGYKTTVCEFIDMEHTPKNVLIKATRTRAPSKALLDKASQTAAAWSLTPYLEKQLTKTVDFNGKR